MFRLTLVILILYFQARSTKAWLDGRNIRCMQWPSLSPDLNPVENIWALLVRGVYGEGRQFEDTDSLLAAINQEWANLDFNTITDLVESMKNRIFNVIFNHGKHCGY